MKEMFKNIVLTATGGLLYYLLEILFRGYSHPAMIVVGGICFYVCGLWNEIMEWFMPLPEQMFVCTICITTIEFVAGVILNLWLDLGIWDYSNMPLNVLGQICLPFCLLWYFLSLVAIVLDDWLRYALFWEERPHYSIRRKKC